MAVEHQVSAPFSRVQPALAFAARRIGEDVSLKTLAALTRLSQFHLHRTFVAVANETPKAYTLRLRLSQAAVLLLTTERSVLDVALHCGFRSHEVFTRAFAKRFQMTPRAYRARGFAGPVDARTAAAHAATVKRVAPCLRLFHLPSTQPRRTDMTYDIIRKDLDAQPVLVTRRRVKRSDIGAAIAEALPHIFMYAQQRGIALAGHPLTRYVEVGAGLLTIEPAMRIASRTASASATASESEVIEDVLPAGPAVTTVHSGPYETLSEAYAALESWMDSHGLRPAAPPWEHYITDPAESPDPRDWKTEVCWPVAAK